MVDVPAPAGRGATVTPCSCMHFTNAVRLALDVVDVVVLVVDEELLPHAAMSTVMASAVNPRITRRYGVLGWVM